MTVAGVFLMITLAGTILVYVYRDDIRQYTLNYLNKNLNTRVEVGTVDISMLRHFPYISATFRNVTVMSSSAYLKKKLSPDTLLKANEVILDINIYNILVKKDIKIERVLVDQGLLNPAKGLKGEKNWDILKKKENDRGERLDVRFFRLERVDFRYHDRKGKLFLKGRFAGGEWDNGILNNSGSARLEIDLENAGWLTGGEKEMTTLRKAEMSMVVTEKEKKLFLEKGRLILGELPAISFSGEFSGGEKDPLRLNFLWEKVTPADILGFLEKMKGKKKFPDPGGKISLTGTFLIKGGSPFSWSAEISGKGGDHVLKIEEGGGKVRITSWKGTGKLRSSGKKVIAEISVDPVKLKYDNSTFNGKLSWNNHGPAPVILTGKGKAELKDLNILFGDNNTFRSGTAVADLRITVPAEVLKKREKGSWKKTGITGTITLQDFHIRMPGALQGKRAEVKLLPGHVLAISGSDVRGAGSRWTVNGKVYRLDEYIEKKSPVLITGSLAASAARLEDIVEYFKKPAEDVADQTEKKLSPVFVVSFRTDTFSYGDVKASGLRGRLAYRGPVLEMKDLSFRTLEGTVNGQMKIEFLHDGGLFIKTYGETDHINVNQLFLSFHDFNQDFIRAENLRGWLSGNIAFQAGFDSTGHVLPGTILSDSYLILEKGELIDFEPLYKLSKFIRLSELRNIKFSKLQNEVFIADSRVVIPDMKVNSSALDLDISGTHYFDKHYNYRIRVYLSDYLARKAQRANKNNGLDLVVEPGERNTSLFLIFTGDADGSRISYDKKKTRQKISKDLKKEKEELKNIFRKETDRTGKDTLLIREGPVDTKKIRVTWPEEEPPDSGKKIKKDTVSGKKFKVIWEEEPDSVPKKENNYR